MHPVYFIKLFFMHCFFPFGPDTILCVCKTFPQWKRTCGNLRMKTIQNERFPYTNIKQFSKLMQPNPQRTLYNQYVPPESVIKKHYAFNKHHCTSNVWFMSWALLGPFAWSDMFLTQAVYINLAISTAIIAISFPLTVLFNGLLIWNIIRRPTLRKKNFMVVIGYLAVTDLASGVFVQPTFIARQLCRITGQCRICDVDTVFYYLVIVTCGSATSHLTLVAWERYIAIKHALRYVVIVTTNRLLTGTIMVWLLEFALNAIFIYIFSHFIYDMVATIALLFCISLNQSYRPTMRNKFFKKERI